MYETLQRPHEVNQIPALPQISEISAKLKKSELKREEKRLKQIASARARSTGVKPEITEGEDAKKRKREGDMVIDEDEDVNGGGSSIASKRFKANNGESGTEVPALTRNDDQAIPITSESLTGSSSALPPTVKINVSKPMAEVRGHTSYLTFACLVPPTTASSHDKGVDLNANQSGLPDNSEEI